MTEIKDIRDIILEYFLENQEKTIGSFDLSKKMDFTEGQVLNAVKEIKDYEDWIREGPGAGDNRKWFAIRKPEAPAIKDFLDSGGFTLMSQTDEEQNLLKAKKELLELEQTELQISDLKRAVLDSKRTRQLSWLAIGISAATLIFEIYKSFR